MSLAHQAISGVKWNTVALVFNAALQFASIAVLARLLDPADFGLMGMAVVVTGFTTAFSDFGLSNAIIHRQEVTHERLSSLYWFNLAVGWSIFVILWAAIPLVVAYYREPNLFSVLRWSAFSLLIVPFGQQFQALLRRDLRFKVLSLIQVAGTASHGMIAIGLAVAGLGVMSLVWATVSRAAIGAALLVAVAARSGWLPTLRFRLDDLTGFARFGLYQMGERSLNYLASNVDYLIIGRLLGSELLGYYTLAYNLMRLPLSYINPLVVSVAFPTFARVQHQPDVLRRGYAKILHYLSAATLPIMVGMFLVAPLLVPLVYGPQWLPAVPVVQILCLLGVLKSLGNPIGSLLLAKGRADLGFWLNGLAIVGYGISNLIGARWGITGVAASSLIFACVVLQPITFYLHWLTIQMTIREYWQAIKRPTAAALMMLVAFLPFYYLLRSVNHDLVALVILVFVAAIIYGSVIRLVDRPLLAEIWGYLKPTPSPKV